jgi:endonuclease YncB( thermonuclease family)
MFPRPWSVTGVPRRRNPGPALFLFVAGLVVGGLVIAPKTRLLTRDPVLTDLAPTARPRPVSLVRVVDGDTFEARLRTDSGREVTTRIRLRSIDTPEFAARCRREYEMAQAARRALDGILAEGDIRIRSIGPDKYAGRIVAEASTRRTSDVSQAMIAAGHARRYAGGRRAGWC